MNEGWGKKILLGAAIVGASLQGTEATSQEVGKKVINLENVNNGQQSSPELTKSLNQLRTEKIKELKEGLLQKKHEISINDSPEVFKQEFINKKKDFWSWMGKGYLDYCRKLEKDASSFSEEELSSLLSIIALRKRDQDTFFAKYNRHEVSINDRSTSPEAEDLELAIEKHPKLDIYYMKMWEWLEHNDEEFLKNVGRFPEMASAKEKYFGALNTMIVDGEAAIASRLNPDSLGKIAEEAWQNRMPTYHLKKEVELDEAELENITKNLNAKNVTALIDSARAWLVKNISSPEYLSKLAGEGLSYENAKFVQANRVYELYSVPASINPTYRSSSVANISGFEKNVEFNAYDVARYPITNSLHEDEHVATGGTDGMPENTKLKYEQSWIGGQAFEKIQGTSLGVLAGLNIMDTSYIKNPSEMDARKKVLEYEMDKLGIKKVFETMTPEHYQQLLKLMNEGKLDHNSMQILLITTEEGLIGLMNGVASLDFENKAKDIA